MRAKKALVAAAMTGTLVMAGCGGGRYRIQDPSNPEATYYAKKIDRKRDGTIRFTDAKSGAEVTLDSSSVKRISKEEWKKVMDESDG